MGNKLPKNWISSSIGELLDVNMGQSPPSSSYNTDGIGIPFMQGKTEFGDLYPEIRKYTTEPKKIVQAETVLLSVRAPIGPTNVSQAELCIGRGLAGISSNVLPLNFLLYYLRSIEDTLDAKGTGTTFKAISKDKLLETNFPLPPLAEQQRIATKLDELFGHLDSLKTRLNHIPQILKNFRQAVLTQAVTGKLTEEWRVGKELEEWREDILGNLIVGTPKNGAYYHRSLYGSGTRIIRIDCFYDGVLKNWDVVQNVKIPESDKEVYGLAINDILINRVNSIEYLGKCMLVDSLPEDCIYESNMMRIKCDTEKISPEYLKTYLISHNGLQELRKNAKHSVNQASINQQDVKGVVVSYPPKKEQTEIVKRVEYLFAKADAIEAQYQSLKTKIDSLPQAILAKAFKGELVAQLDTDGSAEVLLEEIEKLKASLQVKKNSVKRKKK